jgi:Tol biopolymer transport system component
MLGLLACKDSPMEPVPVVTPVAMIDLEPAAPTLARGQQLQLAAIPKSATGQVLSDRPVTWESFDPTVVSVTAQGLATAHREATATLQVTAGGLTRKLVIEVGAPALVSLSLDATQLTLDESRSGVLVATLRNALDEVVSNPSLVWESLDTRVATVENGTITGLREGSTVIRVSAGPVIAQAEVVVRPDFGGELVFVSRDGPLGSGRMYRMDARAFATSRPVFDDNGNWHPAISPDGSRIVYTCVAAGPGICVSDLDGTDYARLTDNDLSYEDQPTWSPDGQRIVFRRWLQGATVGPWNPTDIWIMDANGGNQVNLTSDAKLQQWPQFSPVAVDGMYRIAFVQDSTIDGYETARIATMRPDGSDRRYLTDVDMKVDMRPQWSPNAESILFTRYGAGADNAIIQVDVATGVERRFLASALPSGGQFHPTISPNGRYIVFASMHEEVNGGFARQIYTARADGTDVRLRSTGVHDKDEFSWIPTP